MTLEQLRIFVAVAEREHVTRAAEDIRLTQSAVSSAIAALENRYGVLLFDRLGRGIALTQPGKLFLAEAKAVLARAKDAEAALQELAGLKRGRLAVEASQTIGSYWLPKHILSFRRAWPNVEVSFKISNTARVERAVAEGAADIGFIEGEIENPALEQHAFLADRLSLVIGASHPWRISPPKTASDLEQSAWIVRERGSGTRSHFEAALAAVGVLMERLNIVAEMPTNEAVCAAVETADCATAISELVVDGGLFAERLFEVPFRLPSDRQFLWLNHRDRRISKAALAFIGVTGLEGRSLQ
jgi:DNA-binding transcriptional LysR family regulator